MCQSFPSGLHVKKEVERACCHHVLWKNSFAVAGRNLLFNRHRYIHTGICVPSIAPRHSLNRKESYILEIGIMNKNILNKFYI